MITVGFDSRIFAQQEFGGISRYFYELAVRLSKAPSFRSRIVAPLYVNQYLRNSPLDVYGIHVPRLRAPILRSVPGGLNLVLSPILFRALNADIVHETYFHSGRRLRNAPTVTTVYDMIHEKFPSMFLRSDRTTDRKRSSVDRADIVICISEQTRQDLIDIFGVARSKTRVTYLASSLPAEDALAPACADAKPYLLYVGGRGGYKNFSSLLRAYATLGELRANLRLVAFGGGAITSAERELMAELKLSPAEVQHWVGGDDELRRLYCNAIALVYPSLYEGFGIPPLEAMASRCPVICSPAGSLSEVVGDAALLFDPAVPGELAERICQVVESTALRERLIERGGKRVAMFSWDRCAAETMNIYRELTP